MLSRRDVMGKLAAGAAVACTVGVAGRSLGAVRPQDGAEAGNDGGPIQAGPTEGFRAEAIVDAEAPATLSAEAPWELLRPLTIGSVVAHGWRIAEFRGAVDGSCVVSLQNARGRTQRVHICRNDGSPQGLVYSERFDLVVMNGGQGDLQTEEGLAQAVAELAHVLAANERRADQEMLAALMPHAERVRRFSGPVNRALR
jgi:hypothetical protein